MRTRFTSKQRNDPKIVEADAILRSCVHCGFCTATCPTYVLTGDERESPRGRIWLMRELLEGKESFTDNTRQHLDSCLGCLACETTCPSGVDYRHLLDIGRESLDAQVPRGVTDRFTRWLLARTIQRPARFRAMLRLARYAGPLAGLMPAPLRGALAHVPEELPPIDPIGESSEEFEPQSPSGRHVILLTGCAQRVLDPQINASTVRVLHRLGVQVTVRHEAVCCGALAHHVGVSGEADSAMRATVAAWGEELERGKVDAIIVNASGCGTMVKDYGHLFERDAELGETARRVSGLARDISEYLGEIQLKKIARSAPGAMGPIAYHSACSLQHGQKIHHQPARLLESVGFEVRELHDAHLCCGSAGVYNILNADTAGELKARKLEAIERTGAPCAAAGNIGCITQLDGEIPVRHTVQFIDWATGGPKPI